MSRKFKQWTVMISAFHFHIFFSIMKFESHDYFQLYEDVFDCLATQKYVS